MKELNPLVSIIIPVYNSSNFLSKAIESALAQTYKNIEIIVVNDGSNDKGLTERIALSYMKRIRYFTKGKGGVGSALNFGIKLMKGDYFSWLSQDAVYLPHKIQTQIEYLEGRITPEILYGDYYLINATGKQIEKKILNHLLLNEKPEYALLKGSVLGSSMLIPKQCFYEVGVFNESLKTTQDYDLWNKFIKKYKFTHIEDILVGIRVHAWQDSKNHNESFSEGDALWVAMMEELDSKDKCRLEGSEYMFYTEMETYLKNTIYVGARTHALNKADLLLKKAENTVTGVLVTVIIPFFNRIQSTLEAINSVINQTHQKWELILVNDGSTEDISAIFDKIKSDIRIKIYSLNENMGPAYARNYGLERANGNYIAFLDSDDKFLSNKIHKQLTLMLASNAMFSHTSYFRITDEEKILIETGVLTGSVLPALICTCNIATPTVMLHKDLIEKHQFPTDFRIGEDVCYWIELSKTNQLLGINIGLSEVYVNSNSSAINIEKQLNGLRNILSYVIKDNQLLIYHREIDKLCSAIGNYSNRYWSDYERKVMERHKLDEIACHMLEELEESSRRLESFIPSTGNPQVKSFSRTGWKILGKLKKRIPRSWKQTIKRMLGREKKNH